MEGFGRCGELLAFVESPCYVILVLYWVYTGVILGLYWGYIGVILGLYWVYIGVILGLTLGCAQVSRQCTK